MSNERVKRQMFYYIYKITFLKGLPTGRYYLGKRTFYGESIDKDTYTGSGTFCFAYFKKYGTINEETYIKEILEINPSQEINRDREIYWIGDKYKTDPLCMNLVAGGYGTADHNTLCYVQDKYKKDIAQYDLYGNFIRSWHGIRETARELNINKNGIIACIKGKKPTAFGFQWTYWNGTEEPIDPFYKIIPITQYTRTGEFVAKFDSPYDAEIETGIDAGSIKENCDGKRISAGNYIWRYKEDSFDKYRIEKLKDRPNRKGIYKERKIKQYDKNGNYIKTWNNAHEAVKELELKESAFNGISAAASGRRKTAQGYIWKYVEED